MLSDGELHAVVQGECLSSIASDYGFRDWRALYGDPANYQFREQRSNPNCLLPGDLVQVPVRQRRDEKVVTERRHRLQVHQNSVRLLLAMKNEDGLALVECRYRLRIGSDVREGITDGDGTVNEVIPADAREGSLVIWPSNDAESGGFSWSLKIGYLDPHETISGIQARLTNLGFDCGPADGVAGSRTRAAIGCLQREARLPETLHADADTISRIRMLHDGE